MPANPFEVIEQRNHRLAELLERNHSLSQYLMSVVEASLEFCEFRHIQFEDLLVQDPFIIDDGGSAYIRGRLTVR